MKINIGISKSKKSFSVVKGVEFPVHRFNRITGRMVIDWIEKNRPGHMIVGWCRSNMDFASELSKCQRCESLGHKSPVHSESGK